MTELLLYAYLIPNNVFPPTKEDNMIMVKLSSFSCIMLKNDPTYLQNLMV